jgi:hypothetical protein
VNNNKKTREKIHCRKTSQKWYVNNERRKRKKSAVPIQIISIHSNEGNCRATRQQQQQQHIPVFLEDNSDDEASMSSNFSNTAACCGDTTETYYA